MVDYGNGSIGAGSANLLSNQGGSAGLEAVWIWYLRPARELYLAFTTAFNAAGLTLHAGNVAVAFPEEDSVNPSFTLDVVDVDWNGGETIEVRLVRGESAPVHAATDTPVPTETDTPEPTATDTPEPTATDTLLPTSTDTPSPTATNTPVPTATESPEPTATHTPLPTSTDTPSPTATDTTVATETETPVPTATDTLEPTATKTHVAQQQQVLAPTAIFGSAATDTPSPTATHTPEPTATDTPEPTSEAVTVWSADTSVVDYGTGAIGAGSANLLSNQGGSDGLEAVWLWYYAPYRELYLSFTTTIDTTD